MKRVLILFVLLVLPAEGEVSKRLKGGGRGRDMAFTAPLASNVLEAKSVEDKLHDL